MTGQRRLPGPHHEHVRHFRQPTVEGGQSLGGTLQQAGVCCQPRSPVWLAAIAAGVMGGRSSASSSTSTRSSSTSLVIVQVARGLPEAPPPAPLPPSYAAPWPGRRRGGDGKQAGAKGAGTRPQLQQSGRRTLPGAPPAPVHHKPLVWTADSAHA